MRGGVVARIDIKVGYSETESRKGASSMPNKHNALGAITSQR
jgi:hypothetical protein